MKGSSLVANILEEYLKGTRTTNTETEDLKKKLAEKETALSELHSQDIVIAGLQNELESLRTQVKTLEEKLAIYVGLNNDLKAGKESLQKKAELRANTLYLLEAVIADQLQEEAVLVEELEGRDNDGAFIGRLVIAPCV